MNATAADARVVNVTMRNVSIEVSGGGQYADAAANADFAGPDFSGRHVCPSYGLYLRNLHQSRIEGLRLAFVGNDDRPAIILDRCNGVSFVGKTMLQRGRAIQYDVGLRNSTAVSLPPQVKTCQYPQCIF